MALLSSNLMVSLVVFLIEDIKNRTKVFVIQFELRTLIEFKIGG